MSKNPPFDPPYFTSTSAEGGVHVIETLPDGTTREVKGAMMRGFLLAGGSSTIMAFREQVPNKSSKPTARPNSLPGDRRAFLFLEVPIAEKDEAKGLGARWDAAMRKWYVPHAVDINLFSKWWPEGLKQEAKVLGQL